jgi:protein PhnA
VCIACGNEWPVADASRGATADTEIGDDLTRDANGNVLERGDTVVLVKDLGKGLKKGTKVKNIRLGDYGDGHDIEASIPGLGTYELKSQFLKKV